MNHAIHNSEFVTWATFEADPGAKFHAVLCDPPYNLAFQGKKWDDVGSPQEFQSKVKTWGSAMLPLLLPGALVFMFGGTRTWHREAAGMEDAGFHLWDTLMWLQSQGFPKAQSIAKLTGATADGIRADAAKLNKTVQTSGSGWTTAKRDENTYGGPWAGHKTPQLKPAWEPILCFRAPDNNLKYAELALKYGSGCLNVDAGRIPVGEDDRHEYGVSGDEGQNRFLANKYERVAYEQHPAGRYPANLAMDEDTAEMLDEQSGNHPTKRVEKPCPAPEIPGYKWGTVQGNRGARGYSDDGGVSRFFYVAKANRTERNAGLEAVNDHPTVKPIKLNRWLASLLLPPDVVKPRRLLMPFSGVGSEMIGALLAGWDEVVGVEQDAVYCKIAEARIQYWLGVGNADSIHA